MNYAFRFWVTALLSLSALSGASAQNESPRTPAPGSPGFQAWSDHIRAGGSELAFEAIPWIPSFAEGLKRARQEGRPFLFYAMNGHPLGCT